MGKHCRSNRSGKEYDLLDKLKHENQQLKRELKIARKMLDRYLVAEEKGLIDDGIIVPSQKREKEAELRENWVCYECGKGVLRLIRIGNRYFRKCDHCDKHTRSQVWDPSVKGVPSK